MSSVTMRPAVGSAKWVPMNRVCEPVRSPRMRALAAAECRGARLNEGAHAHLAIPSLYLPSAERRSLSEAEALAKHFLGGRPELPGQLGVLRIRQNSEEGLGFIERIGDVAVFTIDPALAG